ncbi:MAG: hypothetical protein HY706_07335 [Candidatus Hydrogenedentes bacterium]|nr:hypothetical protein [Candidatus Hydrogenedentota bacterium]
MSQRSQMQLTALLVIIAAVGCARAARDTTGFALNDFATVNAPLMDTWQAAKAVLREKELDLYTRDKRGVLVAYSPMKRRFFMPERIQYTITLEELSADSTRVNLETLKQVYGVTLLTYPGWHDRKAADNQEALAILEAIQAKLSSAATPEAPTETPPTS